MGFVMTSPEAQFHFPVDIQLERKPLAEAWLELQWRTERNQPSGPSLVPPGDDVDAYYPLALGAFFQNIRHDYPVQEALPASILRRKCGGYGSLTVVLDSHLEPVDHPVLDKVSQPHGVPVTLVNACCPGKT